MQALNAKSLIIGQEFRLGKILFLFCRCFLYGPIKRFRRHEFRQSDHGCPLKCFFMCIVNAIHALLMPQALQRWNHIFKIAVHLVAALIAHFDGESNAVQHSHSLLIGSTRSIRVTLAVHCHKIHTRYRNQMRFFRREIKFPVLFLIIKRHYSSPHPEVHAASFC